MPKTPISVKASFTSSSLNGLMTASIFFIGARLPCHELTRSKNRRVILLQLTLRVGPFFVLAQIQPELFVFVGDSQPHRPVHDLEDHECPNEGQRPSGQHGDELEPELAGIPEEEPIGAAGIDRFRSEQTSRQCPPRPADPMNTESVQRVIVP